MLLGQQKVQAYKGFPADQDQLLHSNSYSHLLTSTTLRSHNS